MIHRGLMLLVALATASPAAVKSGKASVEWITVSTTCEPGRPLQTAVRMVLDENWHTYWENPGEGGIKTTVEWQLPAGWSAGDLKQPAPKRFVSGGLTGFGYKGTVLFPITLTPPADFSGEAELKVEIRWLTCNADSCIPGEAVLSLALKSGDPVPTHEAPVIRESLGSIPREDPALALDVTEIGETLRLTLRLGTGTDFDPSTAEVFPATPEVLDPVAEIRFVRTGEVWTADAPKSEFATVPVASLELVLASGGSASPIAVGWNGK